LPATSYDRTVYVWCTGDDFTDEQAWLETGVGTGTYICIERVVKPGPTAISSEFSYSFIVPAGCKFYLISNDSSGTSGPFIVTTYRMGSTFGLNYHNLVKNTGITWGLTSNTGVLLPFAQALRNRAYHNGTWEDLYNEVDGYTGSSSINLINLMRQAWTTFGNGAFMKSKPLQWRVTPYDDPGTRGAGYEGFGTVIKGLPINASPANTMTEYTSNSFYLEFIIPDGILHDPSGGWGNWKGGLSKPLPEDVIDGYTDRRGYRYVTVSGQAMVNFSEIATASVTNPDVPPN